VRQQGLAIQNENKKYTKFDKNIPTFMLL